MRTAPPRRRGGGGRYPHGGGGRLDTAPARLRYGATRTDSMTTGVTGAFTNAPPWLDVGVALILFTTSIPSVTLPKTQ